MEEILRVEGLSKTFTLSKKQQKIEHNYLVEVLDVVIFRLDSAVLNVYLIAYLVIALDVLP